MKNVANTQMAIDQQIAEGEKFKWQNQENRELMELDRAQNLADKFEAQEYAAEEQKYAAYGNIANSITSGIGNIASVV